jgi:hypothetical protein
LRGRTWGTYPQIIGVFSKKGAELFKQLMILYKSAAMGGLYKIMAGAI